MLTLYSIPVSLYCAKLRIVLRAKGAVWEEVPPPGGYGSDEYKTVVPSGNLPALRDGDLLIADSEAIAEYLEEIYPDPSLLGPTPAVRALERERGRFHDTRLEPALRAVFAYMPGRAAAPDGFLAAQSAQIQARLEQLGQMLPDDAGARLSLGDCGFPITLAWLDALVPLMGLSVTTPSRVQDYRARVEAHPPVAIELADYTPKLAAFLGR